MAENTDGVECSETNCSHVAAIQNDNGPNSKWLHYNSLAEAFKNSVNNANVKLLADVEEDYRCSCPPQYLSELERPQNHQ